MRARFALILSVLLVGLALALPRAAARCARRGMELAALTPLDRPIPHGAGILLALRTSSDFDANASPPTTVTIGTQGMGGGALTMVETLAPGLYRVPAAPIDPGRHSLRGLWPAEVAFTVSAAPLPPPPPAPDVASIVVEDHGRGGTSSRATMRTPVPTSAVAIVVAAASGPIGYAVPTDRSAPSLTTFGRCASGPDGTRNPQVGEPIVLRYVDAHARLSPPSTAVAARVP